MNVFFPSGSTGVGGIIQLIASAMCAGSDLQGQVTEMSSAYTLMEAVVNNFKASAAAPSASG